MKQKNNKSGNWGLKSVISIQGNKGSYSHIAAAHIFGKDVDVIERDNFTSVFEDLQSRDAEYIVVPIENSTHGSVYQNYDNLTKYGFPVIGELYLKVKFHLITNPGTKLEEIDTLYTHPVGMNQIRKFLSENPQIKPVEFDDTAGSVKLIKEKGKKNLAAAASRFAAEYYEMEVLKDDIQENGKNYTRFFVLANNSSQHINMRVDLRSENSDLRLNPKSQNSNPKSQYKTTIQFVLGEEAGSLYKSLRAFADRDISLSKIESRPILNTDWEYRFYVDVEAHADDEKMQNALREIGDYVRELEILGSYKKGEYIET
ncbi:prephenate dehydratase [Candidatus Dojkabacteria bacterium]|uniref:Prephenate dehydratase n=1 Tax=Candidatus Dojkabacteria bacterium TaxID=2099670 RepID=A0A955LBA9_9BACT|nr:prephenate dehydratase [Candidatus Dojkabacteria bacterium]